MLHTGIETVLFFVADKKSRLGETDFGRLALEEPAKNDGNFRALLRYRVRGAIRFLLSTQKRLVEMPSTQARRFKMSRLQ